jgi:hypothetical protein
MNDSPNASITIDRTLLKRIASWAALAIGALLLLWPVSITVLGTTVTGDPAIMVVLRTNELLQKMETLKDNPFAGLATGPIESALFWAWVRVTVGAVLVAGAVMAMPRRRSAKRAARSLEP